MSRAWTLIAGGPENHWDVGPTFETREEAEEYQKESRGFDTIQPVTCWIDDFDEIDYGYFLIRTDGIHEVSFVVAEEVSELIDTGGEAAVETTIKS
jgi:hypothetical protein